MTRFVSVRSQDVGGPVVPAFVVDAQISTSGIGYRMVDAARAGDAVAGRELVLAVHGFNVSRPNGVRSLARLEAALDLGPDQAFVGILWPGDFWLPVINYPSESSDAVRSGASVAALLNGAFSKAASFSFVSHSLGGRVLLEIVRLLNRPASELCIAAGAVDDDCLGVQYASAKANAGRVSVLASEADKVLQLAYPLGDFVSDVFWRDNDSPWRAALGRFGPRPMEPASRVNHRQIPKPSGYGHGDYFPPADGDPAHIKWQTAVACMKDCINGLPGVFPAPPQA